MVKTQTGLHGKVILTIINNRGTVVFHDTVSADDVDRIAARILASLK